jgi:hypothetical protein
MPPNKRQVHLFVLMSTYHRAKPLTVGSAGAACVLNVYRKPGELVATLPAVTAPVNVPVTAAKFPLPSREAFASQRLRLPLKYVIAGVPGAQAAIPLSNVSNNVKFALRLLSQLREPRLGRKRPTCGVVGVWAAATTQNTIKKNKSLFIDDFQMCEVDVYMREDTLRAFPTLRHSY